MTWRALNAAGQANGAPALDYERFAAQYDAEDETGILHQLVDRFDNTGLVIKTNLTNPQGEQPMPSAGGIDALSQNAKTVAKRDLKNS